MLRDAGSYFDIASIYELDKVLSLGVAPEKLSYGNTIKKAKDIEYSYERGVRLFVTDCQADIYNISKYAPGSQVYVRILFQGAETADWPLSRKFGCTSNEAIRLITKAKELNLDIYGISFHVGSQQRDIRQWSEALAQVEHIFYSLQKQGIKLKMINMGGGFPAKYLQKASNISEYASEITRYLKDYFGENLPEIMLETGRSIVGDAGILISEIITIASKKNNDTHRWVYVDAGKYNGLIETIDESIKYPVVTATENDEEKGNVILAGPTCDSYDIMYEKTKYQLPLNLGLGERLYWLTTGAYTTSFASIEFNGFPPIKAYFMGS